MPVDRDVLDEMHRRLTDRLGELTSGQEWLDWLASARHFHRYSPQNQMLLALQGAHGHVASYRTWQRLPAADGNRCQVARGEKGLTIFAPMTMTRRDVDEVTGDEIVVPGRLYGFKTVKVFHQGQLVSPPNVPERPMPQVLTGDNRHQHVWSAVESHLEDLGYDVAVVTRSPVETWNGRTDFAASDVVVSDHLPPPARLKTLIHEWAHIALDHDDRLGLRPDLQEVEAESVAYLVCAAVGIDSASYSVPYLAGWAEGDAALLHDTAQQVLATTARMIDTLEAELSIDLTPDLLTHADPATVHGITVSNDTTRAGPVTMTVPATPLLDAVGTHTVLARLADEADRQRLVDGIASLDEHLDDVAELCADAGLDATQTAAYLTGLGVDPHAVHQAMAAPVADTLGEHPGEPLFHDAPQPTATSPAPSAALQPVESAPPAVHRLSADDRQLLERMRLAERHDRLHAARLLADAGASLPDAAEVLAFYGLDHHAVTETLEHRHYDPTTGRHQALWPAETAPPDPDPVAPPTHVTPPPAAAAPNGDALTHEPLQAVISEVADSGDPHRLAALADALSFDHADAVAMWAAAGVTPELAAAAAVERRQGDIAAATADLTAAWTEGANVEWARHLPQPATSPSTAHAVLNAWAAQRATSPTLPARAMP